MGYLKKRGGGLLCDTSEPLDADHAGECNIRAWRRDKTQCYICFDSTCLYASLSPSQYCREGGAFIGASHVCEVDAL